MGKGKKDGNSFKMEKSFNAIPTLSKTPTYLSPVCGLWKDISGLGSRGENLPSEAGLGMSYRLLRGWKSLGPDHGFSIQLQPRPGSREEASPPQPLSKNEIERLHEMIAQILRTLSFVLVVFSVHTFFGKVRLTIRPANSAESLTGSVICSCLSDTWWKLLTDKGIFQNLYFSYQIYIWKATETTTANDHVPGDPLHGSGWKISNDSLKMYLWQQR